jgi:hypothetical protein
MPCGAMPGFIPCGLAGTGGSGARIGVEGRRLGGSELDVGLGACESPMLL